MSPTSPMSRTLANQGFSGLRKLQLVLSGSDRSGFQPDSLSAVVYVERFATRVSDKLISVCANRLKEKSPFSASEAVVSHNVELRARDAVVHTPSTLPHVPGPWL
jgi:hypothetical protein